MVYPLYSSVIHMFVASGPLCVLMRDFVKLIRGSTLHFSGLTALTTKIHTDICISILTYRVSRNPLRVTHQRYSAPLDTPRRYGINDIIYGCEVHILHLPFYHKLSVFKIALNTLSIAGHDILTSTYESHFYGGSH